MSCFAVLKYFLFDKISSSMIQRLEFSIICNEILIEAECSWKDWLSQFSSIFCYNNRLFWDFRYRSFHVKWTKFQKGSHLTLVDFADILSSQCTHQEFKIMKILLSSCERFRNYSHLNYGPFSLDIESLQFVTFWKCS